MLYSQLCSYTCYFCNKSDQNIDHILKVCPFFFKALNIIVILFFFFFHEGNFLLRLLVYKNYKTLVKFLNN